MSKMQIRLLSAQNGLRSFGRLCQLPTMSGSAYKAPVCQCTMGLTHTRSVRIQEMISGGTRINIFSINQYVCLREKLKTAL